MSSLDLSSGLATRLDALVPVELTAGDWGDVTRRVRPRRRARALKVAIAFALLLALAAVATGTYLVLRSNAVGTPSPGALTLIAGGHNVKSPPRIVEVRPGARLRVIWRCPARPCGGYLTSVDWAPDGRYVAFTLGALNSRSAYLGLHILDTRAGRDVLVGSDRNAHLGCGKAEWPPYTAATWSPDGRTLAFACPNGIHTIRRDGTQSRRLRAGAWPTWSPDGTHIAFASGGRIYIMRADGSALRLVVRAGTQPDWSPDGTRIAYRARAGIRFVTPSAVDVSPGGRVVRPAGTPAWSPDGTTLAISTEAGVFLVAASDGRTRRVVRGAGGDSLRAAWYPAGSSQRHVQQACDAC